LILSPFDRVLAFDVRYIGFTPIWKREERHCCSWGPPGTGLRFSSEILAKIAPDRVNVSINISVLNLKTKLEFVAFLELRLSREIHD
jgi:hypothetical protein